VTKDDAFEFAESDLGSLGAEGRPWNILIVDDDPGVHEVTEFALSRVTYRNRPLKFHHAFSGAQAIQIFKSIGDLALVLLDVVMESEDAGLRVVRILRQDMDERAVRIILRTGQPGIAPERQIIVDYDINDYKAKTELSSDKLFVSTIAALRAYEDLRMIEELKQLAFATLAHETRLEQQLLDFVPLALLHTDSLLSITGLNAHMAAILGHPAEAIIGQSLAVLVSSEMIEAIDEHREFVELPVSGHTKAKAVAVQAQVMPHRLADGSHGGYLIRMDLVR